MAGLLLEFGSGAVYRAIRGEALSRPALRARLASATARQPPDRVGAALPGIVASKALHPYLGYVLDREQTASDINRFGFRGRPPGPVAGEGELVVGVFGGSVAASLPGELLADTLAGIPRFAGRTPVVIKLALGGYKQPQQLQTLSWLLALGSHFDVVINLDGFNEAVLSQTDNVPAGVHTSYPRLWHLFSRKGFDRRVLTLLASIDTDRAARVDRSRSLASSPLRFSAFVLALWDARDRQLQRRIADNAQALDRLLKGAAPSFQTSGPVAPGAGDAPPLTESIELWAEASRQMAVLCRGNGIEYFHFLQPNQYVAGAKPLSPEERATALGSDRYAGPARRAYPLLRDYGRRLAAAGVPFVDLTDAFAEERRTLYIDDCCHFNRAGYALVAQRIGAVLAADPAE